MLSPTIPKDEKKRILALHALDILNTPSEQRFDRITQLATCDFGVDFAGISFIDTDRQWFKSIVGADLPRTPRGISFCGHTILNEGCFAVFDTSLDPRFSDNPLVAMHPRIRFYVGAPLHSPDFQRIGALCVINYTPMKFSAENFARLRELAYMVDQELEHAYPIRKAKPS